MPPLLRSLFPVGVAACLLAAVSSRAQEPAAREISPPFGRQWGDSASLMERLLAGAKARIVARRALEQDREAWDVEGLQQGLSRTVFYFTRGELSGVELQYEQPGWDDAKYNDFMGKVRARIEQRYGPGQQIVRRTEPEGAITQTVVGYGWNLNNTALELIYYSAVDPKYQFRSLSVHYKVL